MKQSTNTGRTRGRKPAATNGRSAHKTGSRQSAANERSTPRANNSASGGSRSSGSSGSSDGRSGGYKTESASTDRSASSTAGHASREGQPAFKGESHLEKFFLAQLKDIYYAEKKITQSLPKMEEATTTEELKEAFEDHLHQTERHVKRLEKVFEVLGQRAEGEKCEAIEGIAREVDNIIGETEEGTLTRDAALIIAAQKVEHYEIATYGGLVQLAITMNLHEAADLLDKTLVEEEDTDARLTEIAENEINLRAEHEDSQGWQQEEEEGGDEEAGLEEKE